MNQTFRSNRFLQALTAWVLVLWGITAINPLYPKDWLLENLLVFVYAILLVSTYKKFAFNNLSYGLFVVFISLHLVGAHYTYSETPVGYWMQDWFGFERNHYDRLVHFSYGLLCAYPMREILMRQAGVVHKWSYFIAVLGIMAFSSFFEVLEGLAAMLVDPELGVAYLGTQGDVWDAQKDAFLATSGAVISMLVLWQANRS